MVYLPCMRLFDMQDTNRMIPEHEKRQNAFVFTSEDDTIAKKGVETWMF